MSCFADCPSSPPCMAAKAPSGGWEVGDVEGEVEGPSQMWTAAKASWTVCRSFSASSGGRSVFWITCSASAVDAATIAAASPLRFPSRAIAASSSPLVMMSRTIASATRFICSGLDWALKSPAMLTSISGATAPFLSTVMHEMCIFSASAVRGSLSFILKTMSRTSAFLRSGTVISQFLAVCSTWKDRGANTLSSSTSSRLMPMLILTPAAARLVTCSLKAVVRSMPSLRKEYSPPNRSATACRYLGS
mmetsp:Transcript_4566/g.11492  ORF Transcript_4566/g.11492 Transcript_4566/m.11492 type:complete len:248 (-) Transcript_4566:1439-2182(-)